MESSVTRKDYYSAGVRNLDGDVFRASAIIENPCRRTATSARFAVTPLDSQGHVLVSAGQPVQRHFTIMLIMPGQRAAGWTDFTREVAPGGVANLKIESAIRPDEGCWIEPAASGYQAVGRMTDITVGKRNTSRSLTNGEADVSFTITWSPKGSLLGRRAASVIFRDPDGRLLQVGGKSIGEDVKRGQRVHFVAWVPENVDRARTEVILEPEPDKRGQLGRLPASCLTGP
ncbi:MAG: hypothetical protein ACRDOO_24160 [Actinomadura sp.]